MDGGYLVEFLSQSDEAKSRGLSDGLSFFLPFPTIHLGTGVARRKVGNGVFFFFPPLFCDSLLITREASSETKARHFFFLPEKLNHTT